MSINHKISLTIIIIIIIIIIIVVVIIINIITIIIITKFAIQHDNPPGLHLGRRPYPVVPPGSGIVE